MPDGDVAWLHEVESIADGDDGGYGELFGLIKSFVIGSG